jgi:hypothetical protein
LLIKQDNKDEKRIYIMPYTGIKIIVHFPYAHHISIASRNKKGVIAKNRLKKLGILVLGAQRLPLPLVTFKKGHAKKA